VEDIHLTTQDLDYQDLSSEDLVSDHLTDLNEADSTQLQELGLNPQSLQRLIENRPYRSKLELVSRMVLDEAVYTAIKDKVAVAAGREPVKVA
jgi:DNA uptake protein ComE-like DNA-binding protein